MEQFINDVYTLLLSNLNRHMYLHHKNEVNIQDIIHVHICVWHTPFDMW